MSAKVTSTMSSRCALRYAGSTSNGLGTRLDTDTSHATPGPARHAGDVDERRCLDEPVPRDTHAIDEREIRSQPATQLIHDNAREVTRGQATKVPATYLDPGALHRQCVVAQVTRDVVWRAGGCRSCAANKDRIEDRRPGAGNVQGRGHFRG